ncbi:MAG: hypothetical protein NTW72_12265 [Gemmatimonadetes bacterium]|nr:hypothetical protein [Gemmatimonadota bacterium]
MSSDISGRVNSEALYGLQMCNELTIAWRKRKFGEQIQRVPCHRSMLMRAGLTFDGRWDKDDQERRVGVMCGEELSADACYRDG